MATAQQQARPVLRTTVPRARRHPAQRCRSACRQPRPHWPSRRSPPQEVSSRCTIPFQRVRSSRSLRAWLSLGGSFPVGFRFPPRCRASFSEESPYWAWKQRWRARSLLIKSSAAVKPVQQLLAGPWNDHRTTPAGPATGTNRWFARDCATESVSQGLYQQAARHPGAGQLGGGTEGTGGERDLGLAGMALVDLAGAAAAVLAAAGGVSEALGLVRRENAKAEALLELDRVAFQSLFPL